MNGRYLLDTSVLIALFADETSVKEKLGGTLKCRSYRKVTIWTLWNKKR